MRSINPSTSSSTGSSGLPEADFEDIETTATHRSEVIISEALKGSAQSRRRLTADGRGEILAAATPIWSGGDVIGAVIVEQGTTEVLKLQRNALQTVAAVTLIAFVLITLTLFVFTSRLTLRIRRLHRATEQCITPEGRVRREFSDAFPRGGGDEISDLSRSITGMLGRLSQYTRYLESMPDTLAHELNNPLNVVSSSLEILSPRLAGGGQQQVHGPRPERDSTPALDPDQPDGGSQPGGSASIRGARAIRPVRTGRGMHRGLPDELSEPLVSPGQTAAPGAGFGRPGPDCPAARQAGG
ncbi:MAG: hypothetical protein M5U09_21780 [Gammaproteobacteria bacterium]|nr:hypothetical protein [Gammaproteobacteria bacterium]